jgi:hypothetical protein
MLQRLPMFKAWFGLAVALLLLDAGAFAADSGRRFSQAISPEDREAIGLARLSSDQVAILDALVRRDIAEQLFTQRAPDTPAAFTDRLTADERKNTGIAGMSPAQRAHLDATLSRIQSSSLTQTLLTPPIFVPRNAVLLPQAEKKTAKKGLETHGSLTLSYGWGDGYSTRSGSMVVNMTDPDKKYSITIGYGETHVKGNAPAVLMSGPPYYGDGMYLRP